jgi:CHRD domain
MRLHRKAVSAPVLAVATGLALVGTLAMSPGHDTPARGPAGPVDTAHAAHAARPAAAAPAGPSAFFLAQLSGRNEVPAGAGDPDGFGQAVVRIQGTQVCFLTAWGKLSPLTAGHIHIGPAGVNGPIRVGFFNGPLPGNLHALTACANSDQATVDAIKANPAGFYVNLHSTQYPAGAIRGQLQPLAGAVDLLRHLRGPLVAVADGSQEVPDLGDPDGHANAFVKASGNAVAFALHWNGIDQPTLGHIHSGAIGVAGGVAVTFFASPIPAGITHIAGTTANVPANVVKAVTSRPDLFYVNLHNTAFLNGAVRGQLFRAS